MVEIQILSLENVLYQVFGSRNPDYGGKPTRTRSKQENSCVAEGGGSSCLNVVIVLVLNPVCTCSLTVGVDGSFVGF